MNEMNFTECTETRGSTRLLEHKCKVINLSCSPSELSQCQQGSCRKCTQLSPAWGMQCQGLSKQEKLLSWSPKGTHPAVCLPQHHPGPQLPSQPFEIAPCRHPFKPLSSRGWGQQSPTHSFLLPSLLPQITNPLGFQHVLNPLFPQGCYAFFITFSFLKEDPSAPHPIPTRQEQKLLFSV